MSVTKSYSCDICEGVPGEKRRELIGFEFSSDDHVLQPVRIEITNRHICIACLHGMTVLARAFHKQIEAEFPTQR